MVRSRQSSSNPGGAVAVAAGQLGLARRRGSRAVGEGEGGSLSSRWPARAGRLRGPAHATCRARAVMSRQHDPSACLQDQEIPASAASQPPGLRRPEPAKPSPGASALAWLPGPRGNAGCARRGFPGPPAAPRRAQLPVAAALDRGWSSKQELAVDGARSNAWSFMRAARPSMSSYTSATDAVRIPRSTERQWQSRWIRRGRDAAVPISQPFTQARFRASPWEDGRGTASGPRQGRMRPGSGGPVRDRDNGRPARRYSSALRQRAPRRRGWLHGDHRADVATVCRLDGESGNGCCR